MISIAYMKNKGANQPCICVHVRYAFIALVI